MPFLMWYRKNEIGYIEREEGRREGIEEQRDGGIEGDRETLSEGERESLVC